MTTRRNHNIVPACKVDATYWFGPSGWARSTGMHASMARTTGFAGTVAGDVQPGRAEGVYDGKYVVWSCDFRAVSPNVVSANIDWYAASGYVPPDK